MCTKMSDELNFTISFFTGPVCYAFMHNNGNKVK